MKTVAYMNNDTHEMLFLVANEFLTLDNHQKLKIGLKLGLVGVAALMYSPNHLEEMVFSMAYKKNKLALLVKEIQRSKNATPEQD